MRIIAAILLIVGACANVCSMILGSVGLDGLSSVFTAVGAFAVLTWIAILPAATTEGDTIERM